MKSRVQFWACQVREATQLEVEVADGWLYVSEVPRKDLVWKHLKVIIKYMVAEENDAG